MADTSVRIPLVNGEYEGLVRARFIPGGYPRNADPIPDVSGYACRMELRWECTSSNGGTSECARLLSPSDSARPRPSDVLFQTDPDNPPISQIEGVIDPETAIQLASAKIARKNRHRRSVSLISVLLV
ncbi:MAG: hypothetical protein ABJ205_10590 [Erythrobacter sp.]|uniref:hypothetical protein n=1 Tax=Erythrobacter sp. TaxID=1042 RepID=UPI0032650F6E